MATFIKKKLNKTEDQKQTLTNVDYQRISYLTLFRRFIRRFRICRFIPKLCKYRMLDMDIRAFKS